MDTVPHDQQHSNANDAIEALQAKVGADNSAVTSSHDYKIAALEDAVEDLQAASGSLSFRTITSDASAQPTDQVVLANAAGGAITYTLPDLATSQGRVISVIKTDASDNFVTVDGNGSDPIGTAATKVLVNQMDRARFGAGPTAWYILP